MLRLYNATRFSLMGLAAAWRAEAAFRLEVVLFIVLTPMALWLGESGVERALLIGPLFVAHGVTGIDLILGLFLGNFLAVLSWAFICAPIAVRTRLNLYWKLRKIAGPEQELQLFDLLLQTFEQLDQEQLANLRNNCESTENNISVISAFALSDVQKKQLQEKLSELCEQSIEPEYQEDPGLIAGLRLTVGAWVIHLNIKDELKGFADLGHEQSAS